MAVIGMAVGEGNVHHGLLREEDGGAGTMGKGGGGTDKTRGVGGGRKSRERRDGDGDGEPHAWRCREELSC